MSEAKPSNTSWLSALLITAFIIAALFYLVVALNTGDLQWIVPTFDRTPALITVHCYGTDVQVKPGDPAFAAITAAVNEVISGTKRWDPLTMSDETYQEYQTSPVMMVLELRYDPPARIHSLYKYYKSAETLLFPLDGRHASRYALFGRNGEFSVSGSLHFKTFAPIIEVLAAQGLCQKP